jgi:signal peptidase I
VQVGSPSPQGGTYLPDPAHQGLSRRERLALRRKEKKRSRWEWVAVIVAAVLIALLLRAFVVQTFYIPSESMLPTLHIHDRVVVNKLSYRVHGVHRGDVVVFTTPPGVNKSFKDLVKRVVALPGETVQGKNGKVYVNGKALKENYLFKQNVTSDFPVYKVPPNAVWVMGDNRENSEDSRVFQAIPKSSIVGRVFVRVWPPKRIKPL